MISLLPGKHTAGAVGNIKGIHWGRVRAIACPLPMPSHRSTRTDGIIRQIQHLPYPPESHPPKTSVPRGSPLLAVPVEAGPRQRGREGSAMPPSEPLGLLRCRGNCAASSSSQSLSLSSKGTCGIWKHPCAPKAPWRKRPFPLMFYKEQSLLL